MIILCFWTTLKSGEFQTIQNINDCMQYQVIFIYLWINCTNSLLIVFVTLRGLYFKPFEILLYGCYNSPKLFFIHVHNKMYIILNALHANIQDTYIYIIYILHCTEVVLKPPKRFSAKSIANPGNLGIYVGEHKKNGRAGFITQ